MKNDRKCGFSGWMIRNSYCLVFKYILLLIILGWDPDVLELGRGTGDLRLVVLSCSLVYTATFTVHAHHSSAPIAWFFGHQRPSLRRSFIGAHRHGLRSSAPIAIFFVHRRPSPYSSFIGAHRHGLRSSAPIATFFVSTFPLISTPAPLCKFATL